MEDARLILRLHPVEREPSGRQGQVNYLDGVVLRDPCERTSVHTYSNIFPPDDRVHNLLPARPESSTTLLQSCEATNAASCDKRHLT